MAVRHVAGLSPTFEKGPNTVTKEACAHAPGAHSGEGGYARPLRTAIAN
jgi:hypothetical protein